MFTDQYICLLLPTVGKLGIHIKEKVETDAVWVHDA
jgi:hypothetical protein